MNSIDIGRSCKNCAMKRAGKTVQENGYSCCIYALAGPAVSIGFARGRQQLLKVVSFLPSVVSVAVICPDSTAFKARIVVSGSACHIVGTKLSFAASLARKLPDILCG